MRRVIIESPYAGDTALNRRYLDEAIRDCARRGEAPFASHGMYTTALDDAKPEERELGMRMGRAWYEVAHCMAVYRDLGISPGMVDAIEWAYKRGMQVVYRNIADWKIEQ